MLGDRIKQARMLRGLSLRGLAEAAGVVTAQAISNYETGKDTPSSGVLLKLAEALNVELDYLFRPVSVKLGQPAYRKHCRLSKSDLAALESAIQDEVERYLEVETLSGSKTNSEESLPHAVRETIASVDEAEDRAERLRQEWAVGSDPIDCLTELLEDHGIKVIYKDAHLDLDGCSYRSVPVVVVNENKPVDRRRFDLAHELGHLLLEVPKDWDDKLIEDAAHRFAGAFLVPAVAARKELGEHRTSISLLELKELKLKYGMSMVAWLLRARDLGILTKEAYSEMYRRIIIGLKMRDKEPFEPPIPERSTRMERLVARAYINGAISESRAAELLAISSSAFLERLSGQEPACA